MAAGTLYTYPDNFRAFKALIAAEYSGAKVKTADFEFGKTNKSPDFLKKFPLGKVPAFEDNDGNCLYESNAIAYYVASEALHGSNRLDACLVQQYINFADNEILPSACTWVFPTLGLKQFNKQEHEKAVAHIKKCLELLNNALLTRTFLVGERVTLADICVCCNLLMLFKQVLDPATRAAYENVNRWFLTCVNQPQFKKVLGEVSLCSKAAAFDAKKYEELHPKQKKAKAEKPKQEPKKKEEPKKEKAEEPEPEKPKEEKKKDPFADLPPPKMVFDEWKRVYRNTETETEAIPWFWQNIDKEGYSAWLAEYKYNDELGMTFMACNLVSGMFQRLDKLHKNGFASVVVFGKDGNLKIGGLWIFRGQELAFDLNEDWNIDAGSYAFTKLDWDSEEHKKLINLYLMQEGDFPDKPPVNQAKYFV
eukprot:Seg272.3 transcript_id=Seg272.3/GoldUCD/mRNA.D3Y31 product="Elongation factor 1-gamma" protein_id=Seg272.3/GoldUCD/D3Y31